LGVAHSEPYTAWTVTTLDLLITSMRRAGAACRSCDWLPLKQRAGAAASARHAAGARAAAPAAPERVYDVLCIVDVLVIFNSGVRLGVAGRLSAEKKIRLINTIFVAAN
jgi:hypothetical protein